MMCMGLCPFFLSLAWVISTLSYARHHGGAAGAAMASHMLPALLGTYALAAIVSGGGALLSFRAAKRGATHVAGLSALRIVVTVVLALPAFLYATILLSSI